MSETKVSKRIYLLLVVLVSTLLLFTVIGYGSNGLTSAERDQVQEVLEEKYANLPGIEFEFDAPVATQEELAFRPFSNLAISVPNLTEGVVVGIITYGDANYLLIAVELPQEVDANYGAGLIDLSTDEVVFVARADLLSQEGDVDKISFDLSSVGEDSPNLDLVVNGKKYVLETIIPKSL